MKTISGCNRLNILAVLIKSMRLPVLRVRAMPNMEEKATKIERGTLKLEAPRVDSVNKNVVKTAVFLDFRI